jgi:ribosomal-protein-serine acetyltransferase
MSSPMHTQPLDGIAIRRYRPADVPVLFAAARESIPDIYPWMEWCHPAYAIEDSAGWVMSRDDAWNGGTDYSFAICDAATGAFLGGVGLNQINRLHRFANLGYWVRTACTGRGIAAAAARLTARFAFDELALSRVEIVVALRNVRSQRVADKARATREGLLRRRLVLHGEPHDAVMYSLIPDDLRVHGIRPLDT